MPEPRTKAAALEVLLKLRPDATSELADRAVRPLLTPELVAEVFEQAWRHQFEDDRGVFQRYAKEIVGEAVEGLR